MPEAGNPDNGRTQPAAAARATAPQKYSPRAGVRANKQPTWNKPRDRVGAAKTDGDVRVADRFDPATNSASRLEGALLGPTNAEPSEMKTERRRIIHHSTTNDEFDINAIIAPQGNLAVLET